MPLPKNVYTALEDIVGAKNISDDPAILDSYRYSLAHTAIHLGPYFHQINRGQWIYFMGPGYSMAGFGPPLKEAG